MRKTCLLWTLSLVLGLGWNYSVSYAGKQLDLETILSKEIPVMLQFGKSYCPRCKANKPALDKAAKAYEGQAQIVSVDSDVNMPLVRKFKIRLIPTQIFLLPKGREFYRHEGFLQAHNIAAIFSKMGLPKVETNSVDSPDAVRGKRLPAGTVTQSQR